MRKVMTISVESQQRHTKKRQVNSQAVLSKKIQKNQLILQDLLEIGLSQAG